MISQFNNLKSGFEQLQHHITDSPSIEVTILFYGVSGAVVLLLVLANEYIKRRKK